MAATSRRARRAQICFARGHLGGGDEIAGPLLLGLLIGPADPRIRAVDEKRGLRRFFSYYNNSGEIHYSARKHGVAEQDILHAIDHAFAIEDAGENPDRWLLIGPDTAGNLLEVVVLVTADGARIVIHAMRMRDQYARLLDP